MEHAAKCPQCASEYAYNDGTLWICPECAHEWSMLTDIGKEEMQAAQDKTIRDAFGNELKDGDSISVIKDLKVKGSSLVVKVGSKAKNIRLVDADDGHNIACKIEGIGSINLKSEFVKKA